MKNIVLIAGYTKISYVAKIKDYFPGVDIKLACVYSRPPLTDSKKKYLESFDTTIDITEPGAREKVVDLKDNVMLITCTQERDMDHYIALMHLCGFITKTQEQLYLQVVNKKCFKEILHTSHPELVPGITVLTDDIEAQSKTLHYPQVVKPTGLAGSSFVYIADSAEKLVDFYNTNKDNMLENGATFYERKVDIVAEEFIAGRQYSVNAYINPTGDITLCPIMRVIPASEIGLPDTYSAFQYITNELSDSQLTELHSALEKIVATFEIKNTSTHFDSVLTSDGTWKFFEVGLRIGGKRQKIYDLSHGFDHFKNDLLNKLGQTITIPPLQKFLCVVQKASTTEGLLHSITYQRNITTAEAPFVQENKLAKVGAEVKPVSLGGGTITRHIVVGIDLPSVIEHSQRLFTDITFNLK